jgi:three-Cys-motif partner protein
MAPKSWGWWTEQKLDILGAYLSAFTRASKKAGQTVYLDLFAGRADNVSRGRDQRTIRGSARLALETQPPLTHMRFFELASQAASLRQRLAAEYPDRAGAFEIVPGDCNATITAALAGLADLNWAPTFAFLDQQSTEVRWSTIEALAQHKRPDKWKTEIWILCASGLLPRGLRMRMEDIDKSVAEKMNRMFGTDIWVEALTASREGLLSPAQFRGELTNLMRYRLERDLGYKTTLDFQVTNTGGSEIFNMIFATDHPAGEKIMTDLYNSARRRQPALRRKAQLRRQQERLEKAGTYGLFDLAEVAPDTVPAEPLYQIQSQPEPCREPYRLPGHAPRHAFGPIPRPPLSPADGED